MNMRLLVVVAGFLRFACGVSLLAGLAIIPLAACAASAEGNASAADPAAAGRSAVSPKESALALITRLIPKRAAQFACEIIPADGGRDVFEIEAKDGKIVLRGNSALSLAVALNWYHANHQLSQHRPPSRRGDGLREIALRESAAVLASRQGCK